MLRGDPAGPLAYVRLVSQHLAVQRVSAFNDPLDCRIPLNYDASAETVRQHWRRVAKQNYPNDNLRNHKQEIRQLVREWRTPEGRERLTQTYFDTLEHNGIACFAQDPASMLLWSYYSGAHTGICVRFNLSLENLAAFPSMQRHELVPIEVQYQDALPEIPYFTGTTATFVRSILGTKSSAWSHEREWRLVLIGATGLLPLKPELVDGVILGIRTSEEHEALVREWLREREGRALELLRVAHKPKSFELELVPA